MGIYLAFVAILFPILVGVSILTIGFKNRTTRQIYVMSAVVINSIITALLVIFRPSGEFTIISITDAMTISLKIDGLGAVFAGIVGFLWPIATLYAFEYMKHEERENSFFAFYTMTYGVTLGVAFAADAVTLYLFYEFLTLITTPLVFHTQTRAAIKAVHKYLYYSISGAAMGFIAIIFVFVYGDTLNFKYGGVISNLTGYNENVMLFVYVLAFIGFGAKAAIFPMHDWLPTASVAPTPVTALLHAVAVVKAGAFAIMRMTYYIFGVDLLKGTWAQTIVSLMAIITIVYGSSMAVKENHFKRRLAYSTVSNLSYILVGVTLMTPLGLVGALTHMVFHAIMKICSFFCAGTVMVQTDKHFVSELEGLGKKMPVTFTCFTIASLALVGMPPFVGFVSKYNLATAAVDAGGWLSYLSIGAIFFSAILVAIYMLFIVIKAFFPRKDAVLDNGDYKDPSWMMKTPVIICSILIIVLGIYSTPLINFLTQVAYGLV